MNYNCNYAHQQSQVPPEVMQKAPERMGSQTKLRRHKQLQSCITVAGESVLGNQQPLDTKQRRYRDPYIKDSVLIN